MQAIGRVVRIGQKKKVFVRAPYLVGTGDNNHTAKHFVKTQNAKTICGDMLSDSLYENTYVKSTSSFKMGDLFTMDTFVKMMEKYNFGVEKL